MGMVGREGYFSPFKGGFLGLFFGKGMGGVSSHIL